MNVWVGDDSNQVKLVDLETEEILSRWGTQETGRPIISMGHYSDKAGINEVFHCDHLGELVLRDVSSPDKSTSFQLPLSSETSFEDTNERLIGCLRCQQNSDGQKWISCTQGGSFQICEIRELASEEEPNLKPMILSTHNTQKNVSSFDVFCMYGSGEGEQHHGQRLAFGGKETNVAEYDIETWKRLFVAKNLPDDNLLRLAQRTDIISRVKYSPWEVDVIAVALMDGKVAIYDTRSQRRPTHYFDSHLKHEDKSPLEALEFAGRNTLLVGDRRGVVRGLDLRKSGISYSFSPMGGAIKSIAVNVEQGYFVCGGLDRFLYQFGLKPKRLISRVYVKTSINKLAIAPGRAKSMVADDVFDQLEKVVDVPMRGKRRRIKDPLVEEEGKERKKNDFFSAENPQVEGNDRNNT